MLEFGERGEPRAVDPGGDVGARPGPGEQIALRGVATKRRQLPELAVGLDALGDHGEAEGVAEADDGGDDRRVLRVRAQPVDERTVHLDCFDREALQVPERRVAGPEVVDAEPDSQALERRDRAHGRLGVVHQDVLGDLEAQPGGVGAGVVERRSHVLGEVGVRQLPARQVHRHDEARPVLRAPLA